MLTRILPWLLVSSSLLFPGACAIPGDARSGLRLLDEGDGLVSAPGEAFGRSAVQRVMFADPSQREEYALFAHGGAQAEIIYITARHYHLVNVALENWDTFDDMIRSWNHNKNRNITLGDAFWLDADWVGMWVKPFALDGSNVQCAGFNAEWDAPSDDIENRPGKKLFGYFCEKPGAPLLRAGIEKKLLKISISGVNLKRSDEPVLVPPIQPHPTQVELAARVRGGKQTGTPDFPYIMAVIYDPSGGCAGVDC